MQVTASGAADAVAIGTQVILAATGLISAIAGLLAVLFRKNNAPAVPPPVDLEHHPKHQAP